MGAEYKSHFEPQGTSYGMFFVRIWETMALLQQQSPLYLAILVLKYSVEVISQALSPNAIPSHDTDMLTKTKESIATYLKEVPMNALV